MKKSITLTKIVSGVKKANTGRTVQLKDVSNNLIATATEIPSNSGVYIVDYTASDVYGYWYVDSVKQEAYSNNSPFWLGNYDKAIFTSVTASLHGTSDNALLFKNTEMATFGKSLDVQGNTIRLLGDDSEGLPLLSTITAPYAVSSSYASQSANTDKFKNTEMATFGKSLDIQGNNLRLLGDDSEGLPLLSSVAVATTSSNTFTANQEIKQSTNTVTNLKIWNDYHNRELVMGITASGVQQAGYIQGSANNTALPYELWLNPAGGNVRIGTDVSWGQLFAGTLYLTNGNAIYWGTGGCAIFANETAHTLQFANNSAYALQFDSYNNATFAAGGIFGGGGYFTSAKSNTIASRLGVVLKNGSDNYWGMGLDANGYFCLDNLYWSSANALKIDNASNAIFANQVHSGGSSFSGNVRYSSGWKYYGNGDAFAIYGTGGGGIRFSTFARNLSGADASADEVRALQFNGATGDATFGAAGTFTGAVIASADVNGAGSYFSLNANSVNKGLIGLGGSVLGGSANNVDIYSRSGALRFASNGTLALTLETNQNATFAGSVTVGIDRPITIDGTSGNINIKASTGGWNDYFGFKGSSGTQRGGFGARGDDDALSYYYIGTYDGGTEAVRVIASTKATEFGGNVTIASKLRWGSGTFNSEDSSLYNNASYGTVFVGKTGTSADMLFVNNGTNGMSIFDVPTGTPDIRFYGNVKVGGTGTDSVNISTNGITLSGSATVYDDLAPMSVTVGGGASSPTFTAYNGNLKAYEFPYNQDKDLQMQFQLLHSWKLGSEISPHLHLYVPSGVPGGTIKYGMEYTWTNIDGIEGATTTITGSISVGSAAGNLHKLLEFPKISGTGKTLSSIVSCRIFRNGASESSDTFGSSVWLKAADIHIEKDSLGSNQEYIK